MRRVRIVCRVFVPRGGYVGVYMMRGGCIVGTSGLWHVGCVLSYVWHVVIADGGYVEGVLGVMFHIVFVLCYDRRRRCIRGWCVVV